MTFKCEKCKMEFKYNYLLTRHQNNKKPCDSDKRINNMYNKTINLNEKSIETCIKSIKKIDVEIYNINLKIKKTTDDSLKIKNKCLFCKKEFINKGNTLRHLNSICTGKNKLVEKKGRLIEEKERLIEERDKLIGERDKLNQEKETIIIKNDNKKLTDEVQYLRNELNKLLTRNISQNITINNNNTINTQNNLIVINPFGKEDLSHITIEDYKKYLNGFFPGFIKFIEKVHFDENAPQNNNISITNIRSKYLSVHDGNRWITQDKNDVIANLLIKKHIQLADKCEELEETNKIDKTTVDNFEEFCQNYNDIEAKKNTRKNVIMMIYDNIDKKKSKIKTITKKEKKSESESESESESD